MLYQLSHVRMPVRGDLGPVRRISPALRQNFIRSSRNHQLEAGVGGKNLSHAWWRATLLSALSQVRWPVAGTSRPFGMMIPGSGADPRPPGRPPRRGPGTTRPGHYKPAGARRMPGHDGSPRRRLGRIGRGGSDRTATTPGASVWGALPARYGGPGREAGMRLARCYWALRIRSASSVSTSTKSVSSPAGTSA